MGLSSLDIGGELGLCAMLRLFFSYRKSAPEMLPFRDSSAPVADQDPWGQGGHIDCWLADAISLLEVVHGTAGSSCHQGCRGETLVGGFLAGSQRTR